MYLSHNRKLKMETFNSHNSCYSPQNEGYIDNELMGFNTISAKYFGLCYTAQIAGQINNKDETNKLVSKKIKTEYINYCIKPLIYGLPKEVTNYDYDIIDFNTLTDEANTDLNSLEYNKFDNITNKSFRIVKKYGNAYHKNYKALVQNIDNNTYRWFNDSYNIHKLIRISETNSLIFEKNQDILDLNSNDIIQNKNIITLGFLIFTMLNSANSIICTNKEDADLDHIKYLLNRNRRKSKSFYNTEHSKDLVREIIDTLFNILKKYCKEINTITIEQSLFDSSDNPVDSINTLLFNVYDLVYTVKKLTKLRNSIINGYVEKYNKWIKYNQWIICKDDLYHDVGQPQFEFYQKSHFVAYYKLNIRIIGIACKLYKHYK